ncbi:MAG: cupredoxin domain-containing protein [bacterium]
MRTAVVFRASVLLFGLALPAAMAGCGGGGDDSGGPTGRATNEPGIPDGAAFIDQNGLKFSPSTLSVAAGEVVYFKNSETTVHTVTVNGKNESGTMKNDQVFQFTPPAPGEYKITCDFHAQMKSTLTVK